MLEKSIIQSIQDKELDQSGIAASMLRLDTLHPIVSGNKLYKLKYYLNDAKQHNKKGILTFGGAFSNHLVATAYAAREHGLKSIGIVRGEIHESPTVTLSECLSYGMELISMSRNTFLSVDTQALALEYPDYLVIPQGGYGELGMKGASDILHSNETIEFTHIIAACGSGTMGAGIINASAANQETMLISVLKNNFSIQQEVEELLTESGKLKQHKIFFQYHGGGYAKKDKDVIKTMNTFFSQHSIPTDFVYTGKMVHGFYNLVKNGYFAKNSKILLIHSGGLQGNRSLINGELIF